jgi:hypothetical protein
MAPIYLLTNCDNRDARGRYWMDGVVHEAGGGGGLEGDGWIRGYDSPMLAALLQPMDNPAELPQMWVGQADGQILDYRLRRYARKVICLEAMELPALSLNERVSMAILASRTVYTEHFFVSMTNDWLSARRVPCDVSSDEGESVPAPSPRALEAALLTTTAMDCKHPPLTSYLAAAALDAATTEDRRLESVLRDHITSFACA